MDEVIGTTGVEPQSTARRRRGRPQRVGEAPTKKNVTMDGDTLTLLQTAQEQMEKELGFRPTLAQTVARLINIYAGNISR